MKLTEANKEHIESLTYSELLHRMRFAPAGDLWFEGETGEYWSKRMCELRAQPGGDARHVAASKRIGWR